MFNYVPGISEKTNIEGR